jgi:hypothetical protein
MDARRVRFFPAGFRAHGHRPGIQHRCDRRHRRHPADLGDAADRRLPVRPCGRPLGPAADPDGRHAALLADRIRLGLRAELDRAPGAARDLRHRHGRRMGRWGIAHHGKHPAAGTRLCFRPPAIGLPGRIFSRLDRLRASLSVHRLARHVHGRRHSSLLVLYIRRSVPESPSWRRGVVAATRWPCSNRTGVSASTRSC